VVTSGTSKGERMGGILEVIERELEIECLPADLPEKVEIDVTNLELGHSIHISDLPVSGSMKYLGDPGRVVVTVVIPKAVVEEVVEEVAPEAAEAAEGAEAAPAEDKDKDKVKEKAKEKEKGKPEEKSKG
jgi:large subunit ribosomal protein L25